MLIDFHLKAITGFIKYKSFIFKVYEMFTITMAVLSIFSWIGETLLGDVDETFEYPWMKVTVSKINSYTMLFLTCEYLTRFICSPNKKSFLVNAFNFIDLICIASFLVSFHLSSLNKGGRLVRIMRCLRIFRFGKLIRHLSKFQCLLIVVLEAAMELQFAFILMNITILLLTSLLYFFEKDEREKDFSFLDCLEWVIMAITKVGIHHGGPVTEWGKWVGGLSVISGLVLFALPVPIVVASFSNAYKQMLCHEPILQRKVKYVKIFIDLLILVSSKR